MRRVVSPVFSLAGFASILIVWSLGLRLVWEQTVWTWERGTQMVGFSLMHSGIGILLFLGAFISLLWAIAVVITAILRRNLDVKRTIAMLAVYGIGWVLIYTPYGFWQRLFINKFTPSQAVELMTSAAGRGDLSTVRAFIDSGVSVNAQGRDGTALHAAAVEGEVDVMRYLISRGADVNAIDVYGDSPMADAQKANMRSAEAVSVLSRNGARLVQGTKEQHERVIAQRVREDIERMDKETPR